jgi:hypothetical protein
LTYYFPCCLVYLFFQELREEKEEKNATFQQKLKDGSLHNKIYLPFVLRLFYYIKAYYGGHFALLTNPLSSFPSAMLSTNDPKIISTSDRISITLKQGLHFEKKGSTRVADF